MTTYPTVDEMSDASQAAVNKALSGAEDLLTQAANSTADKAVELRNRALDQLTALRHRLQDAQTAAVQKGQAAAHATDDYVHDHPWRSILAAASLGVVVGLLIGRR